MTTAQALRALESAGTEQNRKVYRRHGVRNEMFGVSFAVQRKLAKQASRDQALAEALWATGNHDACILATMVADPDVAPPDTIDAWARDLDSYVLMDAFSVFVAATPHARARAMKWMNSSKELLSAAAWNIIGTLAIRSDAFDDADLHGLLDTIETDIHKRRNRVRHSMNNALIAIGLRSPDFEKRALAVARTIGTVDVDHGETGCVTPDAASYIAKARARQAAKSGKTKKAAPRSRTAAKKTVRARK